MHNSVLSKRNYSAHTRMLMTAGLIAEELKIDPAKVEALNPGGKDKDVRMMRQREAVADLLEEIAISLGLDLDASDADFPEPDATVPEDSQLPAAPEEDQTSDAEAISVTPSESGDVQTSTSDSSDLPDPVVEE